MTRRQGRLLMTKKMIHVILLLGAIILTGGLVVWVYNSPDVIDYLWMHQRDTEYNLAFAFTTALRTNDRSAYDMVDPSLKPRVDEWMNGHRKKDCTQIGNVALLGSGTKEGYKVVIDCYIGSAQLVFTVDNIVIRDMKVIDWGEVEEKYD